MSILEKQLEIAHPHWTENEEYMDIDGDSIKIPSHERTRNMHSLQKKTFVDAMADIQSMRNVLM